MGTIHLTQMQTDTGTSEPVSQEAIAYCHETL